MRVGRHGEFETLLGFRQTGCALVFPFSESTPLSSHMVHRETSRPTFPSVPNHKRGLMTALNITPRTRVVSLISNDQQSVEEQHGVSETE